MAEVLKQLKVPSNKFINSHIIILRITACGQTGCTPVKLTPAKFHGEWNYTIHPRK